MMRKVALPVDAVCTERYLPAACDEVLPGVPWGDPWVVFTPAYWLTQAWMAKLDEVGTSDYRARHGVVEELVFCLLGGFGITAELATAAFEACETEGLIAARETDAEAWSRVLHRSLSVNGRHIHYRYPNQKAKFLASAMRGVSELHIDSEDCRSTRDALMNLSGVGYKTASWVVRNVFDSDDVAILDIHLIRAGRLCGLYTAADRVEKHYRAMEDRFLQFAGALDIRPAALDCLIWDGMREAGDLPLRLLAASGQDHALSSAA